MCALKEEKVTVTDLNVQRQLVDNSKEVALLQTAQQNGWRTLEEYRREYYQVQDAIDQMGVFLKTHSVDIYFEAAVARLGHLVAQQKDKMYEMYGSRKDCNRLRALEEDFRQHADLVYALGQISRRNISIQQLSEEGLGQLVCIISCSFAQIRLLCKPLHSVKLYSDVLTLGFLLLVTESFPTKAFWKTFSRKISRGASESHPKRTFGTA
jgi:hypothetical protein